MRKELAGLFVRAVDKTTVVSEALLSAKLQQSKGRASQVLLCVPKKR